MLVFYILLVLLVLFSLRIKTGGFNAEYLSVNTTNTVKGVFILLVFIKHITPYILNAGYTYSGWDDMAFGYIDKHVGQWIVAMFLFYSGYGIMESIAKKGDAYINSIPKKRILTVLVNFAIAVLVFAVVDGLLGDVYSLQHYLLALIGWESVGNSNWYIFIIMLCYLVAYISFRMRPYMQTDKRSVALCISLLCLSVIILSFLKPSYWYDTMLCFGVGMLYSAFKDEAEGLVKKHYWVTLSVLILTTAITYSFSSYLQGGVYMAFTIALCLLIVALTMRIEVNNKLLMWCGRNLFPLYIYQRIPMIVLSKVSDGVFACSHPILYTCTCLSITILIASCYKYWAIKL